MKYIRTTTPTNIYGLEPNFIVDRTDVTCFKTHGNRGRYVNDTLETEENLEKWLKYNKTSILKQADTIEELCDEYIVDETKYEFGKNKPYISEHEFHKWLEEIDFAFECKVGLYLGIWVGAELKPVAKMNDKGEPELL